MMKSTPAVRGKVRIVHVINSFEFGGAEAMLCNLLLHSDRDHFDSSVVSLIDDLTVADPVLDAGFPLATMGMNPRMPDPRVLARLARHLKRLQPHVVQTWMDHSNLIGGVAARIGSSAKVAWGIHHSVHVAGQAKRTTLWTVAACARLSSRVPTTIVCCSEQSRQNYTRMGFDAGRMDVIPNGFDTERFCPDPVARLSLRREIGVSPDALLVGLVARYCPQKDHGNFLQAAARVAPVFPDARFVLCGDHVDEANAELVARVSSLGLSGRCHLLGPRRDVARVQAALDVAALSSVTEAFPLALGEALSCGVPCVTTDVGDSAEIVGPNGRVVPVRDPRSLAHALAELLGMGPDDRRRLGLAGRRRVRERYDLASVTRRYEQTYLRLAGAAPGPGPEAPVAAAAAEAR